MNIKHEYVIHLYSHLFHIKDMDDTLYELFLELQNYVFEHSSLDEIKGYTSLEKESE